MSDHKHHSPEDSYFEDTDTNDSAEPLSKTELKRQSAQMQKLGEELVKLTPAHLATIPMDEELEEAVMLGRAINRKKDGYRRQLQFIGKLLRQRDVTAINHALAILTHQHQTGNAAFHLLEKAREDIIAQGDEAIQALIEHYPDLDRQKLRQYERQIRKEREKNGPPKAYRELFQYLKDVIQTP
ncbi:ribosome biogenesis factor YjgA [Salinimonas sediminis]|uniref:Dual-action ribosomal maturation protein DarP n=1 Tax=Salinimonas sediminis TaxID=2303538 RepID=A0A346NRE5_9ALTE|nr:ribosome biogenesis factor YjgA [Salinimonas sediminis]AXR08102.1 DUF615 domain-containing protein [Salinimonas sediminis]